MSLTSEGMTPADLAAVVDNNRGGDFMGGNGAWWLIVLFLFAFAGNGWGGGFGGGNTPMMFANTNNDVQRGFDQSALMGGLGNLNNAVTNGFAGVNQALCGGFAGVNATITGGFANAETAATARQMAEMNQMFNLQSSLQNCCCENRAGLADLKYTVATENCADRAAVADGIRDIIASNTANTQLILDKMCQQEIDTLKTQNLALQNQLNMANLQASQTAQTAQLVADNTAQTQYLIQRVAPYPIPSYTVPNPYGTATT